MAIQVDVALLNLTAQQSHNHLAAQGPATAVHASCAFGHAIGYGALAFYTGHGETGTGVVIFVGDSAPVDSYLHLGRFPVVNFENCTNQDWAVSTADGVQTNFQAGPSSDYDVPPTTETTAANGDGEGHANMDFNNGSGNGYSNWPSFNLNGVGSQYLGNY